MAIAGPTIVGTIDLDDSALRTALYKAESSVGQSTYRLARKLREPADALTNSFESANLRRSLSRAEAEVEVSAKRMRRSMASVGGGIGGGSDAGMGADFSARKLQRGFGLASSALASFGGEAGSSAIQAGLLGSQVAAFATSILPAIPVVGQLTFAVIAAGAAYKFLSSQAADNAKFMERSTRLAEEAADATRNFNAVRRSRLASDAAVGLPGADRALAGSTLIESGLSAEAAESVLANDDRAKRHNARIAKIKGMYAITDKAVEAREAESKERQREYQSRVDRGVDPEEYFAQRDEDRRTSARHDRFGRLEAAKGSFLGNKKAIAELQGESRSAFSTFTTQSTRFGSGSGGLLVGDNPVSRLVKLQEESKQLFKTMVDLMRSGEGE